MQEQSVIAQELGGGGQTKDAKVKMKRKLLNP